MASHEWSFGDGTTATGSTVDHTYGAAGTRDVTLTVTDNDGGTGTTTKPVKATQASVGFVEAASTNGNRSNHTVAAPGAAQVGDTLLLFMTVNSTNVTLGAPAGWTSPWRPTAAPPAARSTWPFTRRSFSGSAYGTPVDVDTQDELTPLLDWKNDIQSATGMFYDSGRLYFTRSGSSQLFYRYFTPESDVVGSKRFVASENVNGIDFSQVRGMFTAGSKLFWAKPDGSLNQVDWQNGALSGAPVRASASQVSGPGIDTNVWSARTLFLFQDTSGAGAGQPPIADFTANCANLTCDFDASDSTAPGATITSYAWTFGDGSTASGVSPSHTYNTAGTRQARLTITTSKDATATTTQDVTVTMVNQAPTAAFTSSCNQLACQFNASGSRPGWRHAHLRLDLQRQHHRHRCLPVAHLWLGRCTHRHSDRQRRHGDGEHLGPGQPDPGRPGAAAARRRREHGRQPQQPHGPGSRPESRPATRW